MATGEQFDPRIRRECISRLITIQKKKGNHDMVRKLYGVHEQFNHKNKDYVILVNQNLKPTYGKMRIQWKIEQCLQMIFGQFITGDDSLCMMSYGRNVKKLFSLVGFRNNQTQLKN